MTTMNSLQAPDLIDLGGNVTLLVGQEGSYIELRVSGSLLSLVSRYFATLFSTAFKEGGDAATGKTIKLADDNSKAIATLCKILHMRCELLVLPLPSRDLLDLAIVADKYDCVRILTLEPNLRQRQVKPLVLSLDSIFPKDNTGTFTDVANFVRASYLFDHPRLFQRFTQSMVMDYTTSFDDLVSTSTGQILPMGTWREFDYYRNPVAELTRTTVTLENKRATVLASVTQCLFERMAGLCPNTCSEARAIGAVQMNNMAEAGLLTVLFRPSKISMILSKMVQLKPVTRTFVAACKPGCVTLSIASRLTYSELVAAFNEQCTGLCLDCVKAGGKNEGKCRVEHS